MVIELNRDWQQFTVTDSFNPDNLVSGYISHHSGDDYGAIYIEKVNNTKVPQLILCTPKLLYPFDKNGNWHFQKAKAIHRYEKLDGTNIFAFSYVNADGEKFVSYKTRLTPFLRDSKFGPFLLMWKEILVKYPEIPKMILRHNIHMSFELWGARNPHLVKYDIPLEASLLFIRRNGKIAPPIGEISVLSESYTFPEAPFLGLVDKDYVWNYEQSQEYMESRLKETENGYVGQEGEVWYLLDEQNNWHLFKCKPKTIEAVHWSQGGIGRNIILATCENAFENFDEPTIDDIKTLLKEEFAESAIEKIHYSIEKHLREALEKHRFVQNVINEYNNLGMNIITDKVAVMRKMSESFPHTKMSKVFSAIMSHVAK